MQGKIQVIEKPKVQPLSPNKLEVLKPYVVVSVKDGYENATPGDIVLVFPGRWLNSILNCTKQKICEIKNANFSDEFYCERAFHIQSVNFCYDREDRPSNGAK